MNDLSVSLATLPPSIRDATAARLDAIVAAAPDAARAVSQQNLVRLLGASEFAGDVLVRRPGLLAELVRDGRLDRSASREQLDTAWQACATDDDELRFMSCLRWFRHRELLRIVWRDLAGTATVEQSLAELSALADTCILAAVDHATRAVATRHGRISGAHGDAEPLAVIAMGKLGGGELNFSSDIDVVFLYSGTGESDGKRALTAEEYYRLLAQRVIYLLNQVTADGFVYRVDVRLRPFGDSGPLAVSVSALEIYLMEHGRDWERYAYQKARVVNQWSGAETLYDEILRPFCYRRYLDYGVFDSLRDMKSMIEAEGRRREYQDHLKLGPGGIREIEFIVQSLQLVRGGTISELRERSLLRALAALARHDCLPEAVAGDLTESYLYLRCVENRLQAIKDEQTHDLPAGEPGRARLAFAMGQDGWDDLCAEVNRHRDRVRENFRRIVFQAVEADESGSANESTSLWRDDLSSEDVSASVAQLGYPDPGQVVERLGKLRASSLYRRIDNRGRQRLDRLVPSLLAEAAADDEPATALDRSLKVVESIGRRSAYFSLLNENPAVRSRLVSLCGRSDLLTDRICAHPLLLDELLDPRIFLEAPGRDALERDFEQRLAAVDPDDPEGYLEALRNFQQAAQFRIAVADLSGILPVMKVSDRLTETAELVLDGALNGAWRELVARHGMPKCSDGGQLRPACFAIVGYGKLGGLELGYGSDLDIVFVHDSTSEMACTDGDKSLDNAMFFGRLARRIIHTLTMPTATGELYEVDTRLRPSGRSGLLVTSLSALEKYQRTEAWTWEHQALLRSRGVAGDERVRQSFEDLRKLILTRHVRYDDLARQVSDMRLRMRAELARESTGKFNLKQGRGGIADIEFTVQYLVLREARSHPELIRYPDNIRQLDALAEMNILSESDATFLKDTYIHFRERLHRRALAGEDEFVREESESKNRARVVEIWDAQFGDALL